MDRSLYRGAVRDSQFEQARDQRILALAEQGLAPSLIAQRMSLSTAAVRSRIKRARQMREREQLRMAAGSQAAGCDDVTEAL